MTCVPLVRVTGEEQVIVVDMARDDGMTPVVGNANVGVSVPACVVEKAGFVPHWRTTVAGPAGMVDG